VKEASLANLDVRRHSLDIWRQGNDGHGSTSLSFIRTHAPYRQGVCFIAWQPAAGRVLTLHVMGAGGRRRSRSLYTWIAVGAGIEWTLATAAPHARCRRPNQALGDIGTATAQQNCRPARRFLYTLRVGPAVHREVCTSTVPTGRLAVHASRPRNPTVAKPARKAAVRTERCQVAARGAGDRRPGDPVQTIVVPQFRFLDQAVTPPTTSTCRVGVERQIPAIGARLVGMHGRLCIPGS
jgi:hypothetical protein